MGGTSDRTLLFFICIDLFGLIGHSIKQKEVAIVQNSSWRLAKEIYKWGSGAKKNLNLQEKAHQ